MSLGGLTLHVRGDVTTTEDIVIECHVEGGTVWCEGCAATVAAGASVTGDIVARDITVFGTVVGSLLATEVVDIRASATVDGRVVSAQCIMADGATFNGKVQPQHLETAFTVARHRRSQQASAEE